MITKKLVYGWKYGLGVCILMLLAGCDCLAAGDVGGTHGALLMSRGYEYCYIFDLGKYQ